MTAESSARRRHGRRDLLGGFVEQFGSAIQRHQSTVALRAAKIDAELAYRARGSFLASMNHELRTPLNAIIGFAELLKQAEEMGIDEEKRASYLDYILQSGDLLLGHIDTIIQIADAESGGAKLSRRAFDLTSLVEQVTDNAGSGRARKTAFELDFPNPLPPVDADPDKVAIALGHLLDFLCAEEADNGRILKIAGRRGIAGQSEGFVFVAIESHDTPYDAKLIANSMRVFEQVHETLDRRFDQRRLGLPIAKSYVELNGGKFRVGPLASGGTLVRLALPVADEAHRELFDRIAS